ncbi:hypothetical protein CKO50_07395 [Pseudoalteromonas sp. HM-SA03]|uniref:hypothetical protein n=1 Tax=Pseudoalteromonas sp. HM-SA03 TaxID=2029678 RepID=UPI000BAE3D96|nr:hypothetical protein [Pseudoalteromonas sp. HM-SA03]PAY01886.1 hypothetical protein CKO50_07395 [Pseudoalteromonas sp. HM-SA03]
MTMKQALVFDSFVDGVSIEDGRAVIKKAFKASPEQVTAFFNQQPIFRAAPQRVKSFQYILREKGINTKVITPEVSPSSATIEHVYQLMLDLKRSQEVIEQKLEKQNSIISEMQQSDSSYIKKSLNLKLPLDSIKAPDSSALSEKIKDTLSSSNDIANKLKDSIPDVMVSSKNESFAPEEKPTGFSWWGLLGGAHYVSGYGDLRKGLILAVISGLLPLFAIIVAIYTGATANSNLQVKQIPFSWKNASISLLTTTFVGIMSYSSIQFFVN